jgi:hypothetical protein
MPPLNQLIRTWIALKALRWSMRLTRFAARLAPEMRAKG